GTGPTHPRATFVGSVARRGRRDGTPPWVGVRGRGGALGRPSRGDDRSRAPARAVGAVGAVAGPAAAWRAHGALRPAVARASLRAALARARRARRLLDDQRHEHRGRLARLPRALARARPAERRPLSRRASELHPPLRARVLDEGAGDVGARAAGGRGRAAPAGYRLGTRRRREALGRPAA